MIRNCCGKKQKRWDHPYGEDHNWLTLYGLIFFFNSLFWICKDDLPKNVLLLLSSLPYTGQLHEQRWTQSAVLFSQKEFSTTEPESHRGHKGLHNVYVNYIYTCSTIKIPDNGPIYTYFSTFPPLLLIWLWTKCLLLLVFYETNFTCYCHC